MAPKRINQCQQKAGLVVVTQLSADWSSTNQTRTQSGTDKFKLETSLEPLPGYPPPSRYKDIFGAAVLISRLL